MLNLFVLYFPAADVLDGFGSLITNSISPREISVNLTFSDNVTCFVSRRLITAHACVSPPTENGCQTTKFNFLPQDCQGKAVDGTEIIFGQLAPNTNYCFMVNVSYMNSHYLLEGSARTKRDSGQDPPIINHNGKNLRLSMYMLKVYSPSLCCIVSSH